VRSLAGQGRVLSQNDHSGFVPTGDRVVSGVRI